MDQHINADKKGLEIQIADIAGYIFQPGDPGIGAQIEADNRADPAVVHQSATDPET